MADLSAPRAVAVFICIAAAALVPWLLVWGVIVIVLALTASGLVARGAARIAAEAARADVSAGRGSIFDAAERRLRRGRRLLLVALGCVLALWGVLEEHHDDAAKAGCWWRGSWARSPWRCGSSRAR